MYSNVLQITILKRHKKAAYNKFKNKMIHYQYYQEKTIKAFVKVQ